MPRTAPDFPTLPAGPTRRGVLAAAGAAGALLTLTSCRSAVSAAAAPSGSSGSASRGGTLAVGVQTDFAPALLFAQSNNSLVQGLIYDTLTQYDDNLRPQPSLATSWTVSPDGRTVTLQLRQGVTFHTGRPFTAADVVFAIKNLTNPVHAAQLGATAAAVTGFDQKSDHELVLTLAHPVSNLFDLFEFMIIQDQQTLADAVSGQRLVGTGPFVFDSWQPGSVLSVKANKSYWQPDRPYLDAVQLRVIPEADSLLSSLRSGQTQLSFSLQGQQVATLKSDTRFGITEYKQGAGDLYLGVTTTVKPLDDKTVRQALAWAVDRDRVVSELLGGYGQATAAPWPQNSPAYTTGAAQHYSYNPGKARQLLQSVGATGLDLPLLVPSTLTSLAELVQYDLAQVGVRTTLRTVDPVTAQQDLIAQSMPALWVQAHSFAQLHPATLAVSAYPFNQAKNTSRFRSAEYSQAVLAAWEQGDPNSAAARAAYQRVTGILLDEAFIIELAVEPSLQVNTTGLSGATLNRFGYLHAQNATLA
ncbi:ABC transporter substrate-binding protein [Streptacidiphilus sp. P02-A3a]|uniref:ABC transporter substrate-binding protein n=1 Tax=Streptacidiphilus sp. P02-A3a TaxID=2704468 RepID=UPI0015F9EAFF|nr:ABC transporter substrate-binding protein [Streptacidiphilus sp. P02-A3a]QMU71675.1 ABC transporter substrate-binding protein [Streptacidiphilus sp. P02-A3a]